LAPRAPVDPSEPAASGRTIARNSVLLGIAFGLSKFFSVALSAIAMRVLGPFGFGLYSTGASLVEVGRIVASAGLDYLVAREVASDASRATRIASHAAAVKVGTGALTYLVLIGAVVALDYPPAVLGVVLVLGTALFFENLSDVLDAVFQGTERVKVTTQAFAASSLFLLISGAAALAGGLGLRGYVVCFALSFLLRFAIMVAAGRRTHVVYLTFRGLRGSELRRMVRRGVPLLGATVLALVFHRMDILMLGKMVSAEEVGLYAAAVRVVDVIVLLPRVLATAVYPALRKRTDVDLPGAVELVTHATRVSLVLCSLAGLAVWMLAPVALRIMGDVAFLPATDALRILSWGIVLQGGAHMIARLLLALEAERDFAVVAALSLLANLWLNLLLIPRMGIDGAAVATLLSYALNLACYFLAVSLRGYRVPLRHAALGPIGAGIVAALVAQQTAASSGLVTASAMAGAWIVALLLLRGIRRDDYHRAVELLRKRRLDNA
jgi:O-antigen/teichoic acid export membrane protein